MSNGNRESKAMHREGKTMLQKIERGILGLFSGLMAVAILTGVAQSGSLEPTAAPAPTFKTLDEIPPTWSQILPASERFELVLGDEGVLDKETGIVWMQRHPRTRHTWDNAVKGCYTSAAGARMGWRLPALEEFLTLIVPASVDLPAGHPFDTGPFFPFWTSTTDPSDATRAARIEPGASFVSYASKDSLEFIWCIRAG